ncbi:MAG: hypothetical protein Q8P41_04560 [Pseudomonadota bacterium]|nr:hypothetical protein [Pseudomonadota bacterium]
MLLLLAACAAPVTGGVDPAACDPRTLADGEVRARQIPCGDELVDGGEGRTGDWLLENAHARYVVRGTYASLTRIGEEGGTLVDAAAPGGIDLLLEYLPDGDRSAIEAQNDPDEARLVLPGVTYRLGTDDDVLYIDAAGAGVFQGKPTATRTGATILDDEGFVGVDGAPVDLGGVAEVTGVTRAALSREGLWPDGSDMAGALLDADFVVLESGGAAVARVPVLDGAATGRMPRGAFLVGEREGCAYDGATPIGCGWLQLRVADEAGTDLVSTVTDGRRSWPVPRGGGRVPLGPEPKNLWVWAGPTYTAAVLAWPGVDTEAGVTLFREWSPDDVVLAAPSVVVAPDPSSGVTPEAAAVELAAEGVDFAVFLAEAEVPTVSVDEHDAILGVAGSRAAGVVWSWPWSPNSREPGHGAVPADGLSALDLLAASEGGESSARLTVVDPLWVDRARTEAAPYAWDPRPDAIWLDGTEDIPLYLALLDDWVDIAPLGPRTWIGVDADRNVPAYEAGIVDGRTTAGTGPRLAVTSRGRVNGAWGIDVTLDAPGWMGMQRVQIVTSTSTASHDVEGGGRWKWTVPADATWVVAIALGDHATPGTPAPAWAVSAPLWIERDVRPGR